MRGDQSEQKDAARLKKLLKNLDPEHKHLEDIQAKRVGYAIKILNDNVKLVSVIAALCDEFKDKRSIETSQTLENEISKHTSVSKIAAGNLFEISAYLRGNMRMEEQFKISLRNAFAALKKEPKIEPEGVASASAQALITTLDDLWGIARDRLLTCPKEENRKLDYLRTVLGRSRRSYDLIINLEKQLQESIEEKNASISSLDLSIKALVLDLETANQDARNEHDRISSDTAKQISSEGKVHDKNAFCLLEQLHSLQNNLRKNKNEHFKEETYLRKKSYKLRTELHNWISKYDQDLEWRQDEIEELLELQALNQSDLKILEEQFSKLEIEYEKIVEERRIKEEKTQKRLEDLAIKVGASLKIQAFWRGYLVRRVLRGRYTHGGKRGKDKKKKSKK
ncbi:dynein regulatory complex protein 10-like [Rhopilema esculentum]|uniref:dynein regulatory complex protein 10-like n=1 Tax=Rhopilema esculentum TaxID=499914 RepID=UPI0031E18F38